ncbi:hypothetical protein [Nakamurella sp.]|uniref:hypothetical protein n=1 Tax=Nakamurella sp. TaxID=1869182 RepID=UPI00378429D0
MTVGTRLRAGALSVGVLILVAGCTTSAADGPTSTPVVSVTATPSVVDPSTFAPSSNAAPASPSPSVAESSASPSGSADISPQEAADRAAIAMAWSRFWSVSDNLWRLPESDRAGAASAVAVEPTISQAVEQARVLQQQGLEAYGTPSFHPYWEQKVDGQSIAVMGDCTDTSQTGAQEVATGTKTTVGVPERNTRSTFVRGDDGYWRVQKIEYIMDEPCP